MRRLVFILLLLPGLAGASVPPGGDKPTESAQSQQVSAGPVAVVLELNRAKINVASSLSMDLRVTAPRDVRIEMPASGSRLGEFAVASETDEAPVGVRGDQTLYVRHYRLDPFLPGKYTVPPLQIAWHKIVGNESGVARTSPMTIEVSSLLPPAADAPGAKAAELDTGTIRDEYFEPGTPQRRIGWIVACVFAAGVVVLVFVAWRRRRQNSDPWSAELARLRTLAAGQDAERAKAQLHELAGAFRRALATRIEAASTCTAEDAQRVLSPHLSEDIVAGIGRVLKTLDRLRFAPENPTAGEYAAVAADALERLGQVGRFVQQGGGKAE
ncbi:MAG: DUF4381 family protein [Phycisphaerales bacterium]|nr:DUF4381 family protein [Planctomycetota bacterium]